MVAERTAVRFEKEQDSPEYMTGHADRERSSHVFLMPHVLSSMLKEPRYRNGICVASRLNHNLLEEPNLQSMGLGQDAFPRSMAWKHCCASSGHTMPSLHAPTRGRTVRHFLQIEKGEARTRYRKRAQQRDTGFGKATTGTVVREEPITSDGSDDLAQSWHSDGEALCRASWIF